MIHAGVYAAVTHYLKAVGALGGAADGKAVVAKMKEMPTDDPLFGKGSIRPDGRKIHDMYLFEVKQPRIKAPVGLLQAARDHPGRGGVPSPGSRRLSAGQRLSARKRQSHHLRAPGSLKSGPALQRRREHVMQTLARHLWRKNSVRDQSGCPWLGAGDAREAAMQRFADRPAFRCFGQHAHLCRHRPAVAPLRRLPARQARREEGRSHRGDAAQHRRPSRSPCWASSAPAPCR